jgi:hypothetical protein
MSRLEVRPPPELATIETLLADTAPQPDEDEQRTLGAVLRRIFGTSTKEPS